MEKRPNPLALLKRVQAEEQLEKLGKLKIYLGAAPGVGKTYTMLQDAIVKRKQGLDVVIGIVESHRRNEIEALMANMECLPLQQVNYRGQQLPEFDLDAALKRNPALILIDEMAHTNAPGLRHSKRWQDIKEILDRGIDVYTTLNVQHIESLNDVISQILHIHIKETVPDSMLDMADTIELVDLPPEDLLKRLQEGKVYFPQQAELAAERFFRKGNLFALRELALRTTAERVDAQVLLYRQGQGIKYVWPTKEKILVCVGSRTESSKLIRAARRLANRVQAEWIAVHVDTPRLQLSEQQRHYAIQNLRLAEQLGGDTRVLSGVDVVTEIMNFAREQNITQIVIGKRIRPRFIDFLFGSIADEVIRKSGEIDVYIITAEPRTLKPLRPLPKKPIRWRTYGISVATVAIATVINLLCFPYLNGSNLIMIYLLTITIVAMLGEVGPSLLASLLSVVAYDYFFVSPYYTLDIPDLQYLFTLIVMLLVSYLISHLRIITRNQAKAAQLAERRTAILHTLSKQLAATRGVDKLLSMTVAHLGEVFDSDIIMLLFEDNHLVIKARYQNEQELSEKERGVAQWVFDLGQIAGLGTDTLPFSDALYIPLLAPQGTIGVIRVHPHNETERLFTPEQIHLLEACANLIATAIQVDTLQEKKKKSELQTEMDKEHNALLQSVSHDLRTPLMAVMGAASTLSEMSTQLDANKIKQLGHTIYVELEQLNRLINNILQMTYLEAHSVKLQKKPHSISSMIHLAVKSSSEKLDKKPIKIDLPDNLPMIPFDDTLIQEVLINLIDNAIKFTPPNTPITISAKLKDNDLVISVTDQGPGIMQDEVNQLFEKFYRGRLLSTERGLGLGLAICRSIVIAHGGNIWAENREGGGAIFSFSLPLK